MRKIILISLRIVLPLAALLILLPGVALANGKPVRTMTFNFGSYAVDVNLFEDPPRTDQPLDVTVLPHDSTIHPTGRVIAQPGPGTDADQESKNLTISNAFTDEPKVLAATINFPVRGAWRIIVQLNGPWGQASASFNVNVLGPGPIPLWLAWLIGLSPVVGILWLAWQQTRYRRKLLTNAKMKVQH